MNRIQKKGMLCAWLLVHYGVIGLQPNPKFTQVAYQKPSLEKRVDEYIERSYVTPVMQQAVFTIFNQPFAFDSNSGKPIFVDVNGQPQSWPTIGEIYDKVREQYENGFNNFRDEIVLIIEVVNMSIGLATLEAMYNTKKDQNWFKSQKDIDLINQLVKQRQLIELLLPFVSSSSTLPEFFNETINQMQDKIDSTQYPTVQILLNDQRGNVLLENDYLQLVDRKEYHAAAQLLFKECFIVQNDLPFGSITLPNNSLKMDHYGHIPYIFKNFDDLGKMLNHGHKLKVGSQDRHQLAKAVYFAAKQAEYLAQLTYTKSWSDWTWSFVSDHPLVKECKKLSAQADKILKDPQFGALPGHRNDSKNDERWNAIRNTAIAATVITGLVAGAVGVTYIRNPEWTKEQYRAASKFLGGVQDAAKNPLGAVTKKGEKIVKAASTAAGNVIGTSENAAQYYADQAYEATNTLSQLKMSVEKLEKETEALDKLIKRGIASSAQKTKLKELQEEFNNTNELYSNKKVEAQRFTLKAEKALLEKQLSRLQNTREEDEKDQSLLDIVKPDWLKDLPLHDISKKITNIEADLTKLETTNVPFADENSGNPFAGKFVYSFEKKPLLPDNQKVQKDTLVHNADRKGLLESLNLFINGMGNQSTTKSGKAGQETIEPSQPASQPASQPVSQPASQPVSQSVQTVTENTNFQTSTSGKTYRFNAPKDHSLPPLLIY